MSDQKFKQGQKVKVKTRAGTVVDGKFVAEHPYPKGAYLEVDHGASGAKRYRASAVSAA